MLNRRSFFAVSMGAALYPALSLPAEVLHRPDPVLTQANLAAYQQGLMTFATFQKLQGTRFWVQLANGSRRSMVLQKVTQGTPQVLTPRQTEEIVAKTQRLYSQTRRLSSFTAVFQIEGEALPQDNYVVDSGILGRFAALLVPGQGATCHMALSSLGPEE